MGGGVILEYVCVGYGGPEVQWGGGGQSPPPLDFEVGGGGGYPPICPPPPLLARPLLKTLRHETNFPMSFECVCVGEGGGEGGGRVPRQ